MTLEFLAKLNAAQLRARAWLIEHDPTPDNFWESQPLDSDFVSAMSDNLRDFGHEIVGARIIFEAKEAGWVYDAPWRPLIGVSA